MKPVLLKRLFRCHNVYKPCHALLVSDFQYLFQVTRFNRNMLFKVCAHVNFDSPVKEKFYAKIKWSLTTIDFKVLLFVESNLAFFGVLVCLLRPFINNLLIRLLKRFLVVYPMNDWQLVRNHTPIIMWLKNVSPKKQKKKSIHIANELQLAISCAMHYNWQIDLIR